jgi:uncharacterized protein YecE (DUF72 family)
VPDVYALLREHDVALVIGDHPERPFQSREATADWRYVRMHYGRRGRRGNYSQRELEIWARRVHDWRADGCVYVYFNNDWEAFAPRDALELCRQVRRLAGEGDEAKCRRVPQPRAARPGSEAGCETPSTRPAPSSAWTAT